MGNALNPINHNRSIEIITMQINITVNETTAAHLKALAEASGDTPETLAEFLLNDAVLSAVEDPELIGNE
jgi:hypothetical protein